MVRLIIAVVLAGALTVGCAKDEVPHAPSDILGDSEATMLFNADQQLSPGDTDQMAVRRAVVYCTARLHHRTRERGLDIAFDHPGKPMPVRLPLVQAAKEFTVAAQDMVCDLVRKHERSTVT